MGERTSDAMNFDLNLDPILEPPADSIAGEHAVSLDDWTQRSLHRINEGRRYRSRLQWRSRHLPVSPDARRHDNPPPESQNFPMEINQFVETPDIETTLQVGQDGFEDDLRSEEVPKACENNNTLTRGEELEKKDDVEKGIGDDGGFFDCNICLDLAKDPVVTCCGHLFCWPCLYRWLHMHSDVKECPVCKGDVSYKTITPIYGRGNNNVQDPEEDPTLKVPLRPPARRVEGLRPTTSERSSMEEMIRRLGGRVDLSRVVVRPHDPTETVREAAERTRNLLNRFLTSRAIRREQNFEASPDDAGYLTGNNMSNLDAGDNRRLQSILLRTTQSHRATLSSFPSAISSAERVVETYFRTRAGARNQEQASQVDDRDSYSSIAAVINSESQVVTAVETDSTVSLSTSSSRRRNDSSRVSDADTGDSRAPRPRRRRRLR
ncbi:hypothetical protein QN277_021132 [Acacia crassicarpa]|uniref:E3 ubiquitin-protein ligase RMA n=1 Tax=Acacia crassicarpa TaxID=499986 RepID=A0AAE1KFX0_9FABA|nr:hypothetical protein QN277_021132 [Acacia crassicarpa]